MAQWPARYVGVMLFQCFVIALLSFFVRADEVYKKLCADVDSSQCVVHSVNVEPCLHGPRFCSMIFEKKYNINVNFTPYFSTHDVMITIISEPEDGISIIKKTYKDACQRLLTCPLEDSVKQSLDIPLKFDTIVVGRMAMTKFPVQVKLWNTADKSQACCFTFKAKVK